MASRKRRRKPTKKKTGVGRWLSRLALWCFIFLLGVWVTLMALSTVQRNLPNRGPILDVAEVAEPPREYCVDVWNGNGRHGAAASMAIRLREQGFVVDESENAARYDYPKTVVVDRVGDPDTAKAVAEAVGGTDVVLQRDPNGDSCNFLVIVGHDWAFESD